MGNDADMNVSRLLLDAAARVPGKPALIPASGGEAWTFEALADASWRIAAGLRDLGLATGDRVAIAAPNVPSFAASYFGILAAGGVAVPLNVMLSVEEVRKILEDSGARFVLALEPHGGGAADAASSLAGIERTLRDEEIASLGSGLEPVTPLETAPGDLAVLAYTSGTTGEAKGAMLTHGNLLANIEQQMAIPEDHVREDDILFLALPLFHIFGLNVTLGLLAKNGATGILVERFDPVPALETIAQHRATVLFGAPTMYVAFVNTPGAEQYDLTSVRLAISGAAPLPVEVLASFKEITGIDIYEGYGLTETSPTLMSCRMAPAPKPGSVGMPLPGIEVRLVDEKGQDVQLGDPGEVAVRGPNVFQGYWNRPDETERSLIDGWFHTGDIAVLDEEGYYYLVDRKRDLIIVSGFNVFPSEVEAALMQDHRISEAAVVGVPHTYTGEAVKAYVTLAEGAEATPEELQSAVTERLARFKCPEAIEIVDELPHLLTGKVLRRALRD